jgi:hypothetical protein
MPQTLKLNNEKRKKSSFFEKKSLVGLTPGYKGLESLEEIVIFLCYAGLKDFFYSSGDKESGKTTLIAKLQGNEDPKKGAGLEYGYINVRDEYREGI